MSVPAETRDRPAEAVAGLMAAISIAGSLIALAYRPARVTPFTILIALIAAAIGGRSARLSAAAVAIGGFCFAIGLIIAIVTGHPIV